MEKIILKSTTKKMISKLDDEKKVAVNNYLRTMINLQENLAFEIFELIKISPRKLIGNTIITDDTPFYVDPDLIDEDIIIKTYPDIIVNYRINNPKSWLSKEYELFDENLRKEFNDDQTLMTIIERRVEKRFKECEHNLLDLDRLKALLTCVDDEKKRFGGLMELGFSKAEGDYFKNHTGAIWNYVLNKHNFQNTEKKEDEKMPKEITEENVSALPEESSQKQPSARQILDNSTVIDEFFDAVEEALKVNKNLGTLWVKLENLGIDPDFLIYKKEKIMNLLASAEDYTAV